VPAEPDGFRQGTGRRGAPRESGGPRRPSRGRVASGAVAGCPAV